MFELHNFEILGELTDGQKVIEKYSDFNPKPDIILLDYRITPKNGLKIMQELLKIDPNAKLLIISADYTIRDRALEAGAKGFLLKPIKENKILSTMKKILIRNS